MQTIKALVANRLVLMVLTTAATAIGTVLATDYPAVYSAVCVS